MNPLFGDVGPGHAVLLAACVLIALGFEFVNGFHDTANAVATVIDTKSLKPRYAVVLSGLCNFTGVFLGGIAVAMGIIKLLPVELLVERGAGVGLAMVLALHPGSESDLMDNLRQKPRGAGVAALIAGLVALTAAAPARAAGPDPLNEAEAANARVDFEAVRSLAQAALKRGGYDRQRLMRVYFLLGVSNAALGHEEPAFEAFKRLLELDPQTKIDQDLSPKLRSPMHEARGFWASRTDHLALEAAFARGEGVLRVRVSDTLPMGRAVLVRARVGTTGDFVELKLPAAPLVALPIPGAAGAPHVEYMTALLDEYGNRLVERGSELSPIVEDFTRPERPTSPGSGAVPGASPPSGGIRRGYLVTGIVGEVLGLAALGGGVGAWVVASSAADRWNNDSVCLAGGKTREVNCSLERSTAETAHLASIAALSVGGALVLASTVLLLAAPRAERAPAVTTTGINLHCGPGPGWGLACGGQF